MAHKPRHIEIFQIFQNRQHLVEQLDPETKPAHARIDLEVIIDGPTGIAGRAVKPAGQGQVVEDRRQPMFEDIRFLTRENAAQDKNRLFNTQPAQFHTLFDEGNTEQTGPCRSKGRRDLARHRDHRHPP